MVGGVTAWRLMIQPPKIAGSPMEQAFGDLRDEQGVVYAPLQTKEALAAQTETMERWRAENLRWFFLREYDAVDTLASNAVSLARAATARTIAVKDSLTTRTDIGLTLLRDKVTELTGQLEQLPHMHTLRNQLLEAQAHLVTVEQRQQTGDLLGGAGALDQASSLLDRAGITLDRVLSEYLEAIPQWRQWAAETISWSKSNRSVSIVVDKMAHRCYVYRNGREIASFDVELGPQWVGPKRFEGDLSTPEGKYFVKRKRGPGETIYYLALEINYPNDDDRRRFREEKRVGTIPRSARLGGNIELHGEGGKAFNWTKGCVALSNPDMRTVYDLVSVRTPVTIVGALENPFLASSSAETEVSEYAAAASVHSSK